jgi:hypothetical protein
LSLTITMKKFLEFLILRQLDCSCIATVLQQIGQHIEATIGRAIIFEDDGIQLCHDKELLARLVACGGDPVSAVRALVVGCGSGAAGGSCGERGDDVSPVARMQYEASREAIFYIAEKFPDGIAADVHFESESGSAVGDVGVVMVAPGATLAPSKSAALHALLPLGDAACDILIHELATSKDAIKRVALEVIGILTSRS